MMGRLSHDQEQFFYSFRLDEAVPEDHAVRARSSKQDRHTDIRPRDHDVCFGARSRHRETMAYFASVAAFSINAATSGACERKIAWLPGSSMTCDWARFVSKSLKIRIDHSVLHGNYCVARLLFPSRNCGLRLQCIT